MSSVFYGAVINPQTLTSYQALPRCLLAVSALGTIEWIVEDVVDSMVQDTLAQKGYFDVEVVVLKHGQFLLPGFVDTHTHAPQVPNVGSGQQYELLDWLQNITFPTEAKFADVDFAQHAYKKVVRRIIDSGTTTCCYYGTLHLEATKILADIVHQQGQRAFIGKCNMDRNAPDYYVEPSPQASLSATQDLIHHIRSLVPSSSVPHLVHPILTPRFAISCSTDLLSRLHTLAASSPDLAIQTHISENPSEVTFTLELFPECTSYAAVYDKYGLLRENTVLAHAIHLTDEEKALIKKRKAGVSHCPTSNFNLSSGVAKVGELLDLGIKVGLGTDVSGGFSPSILTAIQHASMASKVVAMQPSQPSSSTPITASRSRFANRALPIPTLFYLATMGGAEVCNLDERIGNFVEGKNFDALLVNIREDGTRSNPPGLWGVDGSQGVSSDGKEDLDGMLERFLFCGDDRNISCVYVQGRLVGGTSLNH